MIDGIGYTEDGQVWMRLVIEINGQRGNGTLILKPDFAREVAKSLITSADKAAGFIPEKTNERDSPNPDQSGA